MNKKSRVLIVGHEEIIAASLYQHFKSNGFTYVYFSPQIALDVLSQSAVQYFFDKERPEYVFLASIRSGGITANQKFAAEFIYENLQVQNNIIHAAYQYGVRKFMFFASSCVYPKECPQPMKEESLLTGPLENTNEPYAVAKIAGIKLCQAYKKQYGFNTTVAIPATVYGPGSETDLETAHVMGALIGKFSTAKQKGEKEVVVWGTGNPRREFLFVDDFVAASLFLMERDQSAEMINIGDGYDVSIKELSETIKKVSGFQGRIVFDATKPDGMIRKWMDNSRLKQLGWRPKVELTEGIQKTYDWFVNHKTMELVK